MIRYGLPDAVHTWLEARIPPTCVVGTGVGVGVGVGTGVGACDGVGVVSSIADVTSVVSPYTLASEYFAADVAAGEIHLWWIEGIERVQK